MQLAFRSDEFQDLEITSGGEYICIYQGDDVVVISNTDLPRFIHELKIVENEGNKID